MTEQEWMTGTNPHLLLEFMRGKTSNRKWRLFACACCRGIWPLITDQQCRDAVEVAEKYADSTATRLQLTTAYQNIQQATTAGNKSANAAAEVEFGVSVASEVAVCAADATVFDGKREDGYDIESQKQGTFVRDIFGNPFRPVTADPAWLTTTVVALATGIYDERAFDRMPILADALQDAGCDNADILDHCRGLAPHAKGCWVIDLVLGKE